LKYGHTRLRILNVIQKYKNFEGNIRILHVCGSTRVGAVKTPALRLGSLFVDAKTSKMPVYEGEDLAELWVRMLWIATRSLCW